MTGSSIKEAVLFLSSASAGVGTKKVSSAGCRDVGVIHACSGVTGSTLPVLVPDTLNFLLLKFFDCQHLNGFSGA